MRKVLLIFLIWSLGLASVGMVLDFNSDVEVVEVKEVTVQEGDSLWNYINRIDGRKNYDGHQLIEVVQEMNDLDTVDLTPGQTIILPSVVK